MNNIVECIMELSTGHYDTILRVQIHTAEHTADALPQHCHQTPNRKNPLHKNSTAHGQMFAYQRKKNPDAAGSSEDITPLQKLSKDRCL